jgi:hypothetical protein
MAIVVIGGLITSTFLSLLVIPVLYTLVDDAIELSKRLRRRRPTPADGAAAPEPGPVAALAEPRS